MLIDEALMFLNDAPKGNLYGVLSTPSFPLIFSPKTTSPPVTLVQSNLLKSPLSLVSSTFLFSSLHSRPLLFVRRPRPCPLTSLCYFFPLNISLLAFVFPFCISLFYLFCLFPRLLHPSCPGHASPFIAWKIMHFLYQTCLCPCSPKLMFVFACLFLCPTPRTSLPPSRRSYGSWGSSPSTRRRSRRSSTASRRSTSPTTPSTWCSTSWRSGAARLKALLTERAPLNCKMMTADLLQSSHTHSTSESFQMAR